MSDAKLNSTTINEKMNDGNDSKEMQLGSLHTVSQSLSGTDSSIGGQTGSLTGVTSCLEEISTEDTELSSTQVFVNVVTNETIGTDVSVETNLHNKLKNGVTSAESICSSSTAEKNQPCALLPSSVEACTVHEVNHSFTPISRRQQNLQSTNNDPDGDDLCAAVLLACLFCHPLDCLLATMRGCNGCIWSLCSFLCGCQPTDLPPLLDVTHHCDLCRFLGVQCCQCDCPVCDVCLQATECLDLAMEISQMLFH